MVSKLAILALGRGEAAQARNPVARPPRFPRHALPCTSRRPPAIGRE